MEKQKILTLSLSIMLFLAASYIVYSWTEPTTTMPSTYTTPLNTSGTAQFKTGELGASSFSDTDNPDYYLNPSGNSVVSGTITVDRPIEADNVATKGYVDEKIAEVAGIVTGAQPLVNGVHSKDDCTSAGGEVVDSSVSYKICKFESGSCPAGWSRYQNFSTAISNTPALSSLDCYDGYNYGWTCTAGAKAWANATYSCTFTTGGTFTFDVPCCVARCYQGLGSDYGWNESIVTATRTQIGCY